MPARKGALTSVSTSSSKCAELERIVLHLLPAKDESLLNWRNAFLLFDFFLDPRDLVCRLDVELDLCVRRGVKGVSWSFEVIGVCRRAEECRCQYSYTEASSPSQASAGTRNGFVRLYRKFYCDGPVLEVAVLVPGSSARWLAE